MVVQDLLVEVVQLSVFELQEEVEVVQLGTEEGTEEQVNGKPVVKV